MRCSVNGLLQLATKPRLQSMRSDTSSHVWPSASSKISRARRASSARSVRLLARRVSSISSEFDNVMASLMDAIIVYKWLLQSTRPPLHVLRSDSSPPGGSPGASVRGSEPSGSRKKLAAKMGFSPGLPLRHHDHCVLWRSLEQPFNIYLSRSNKCKSANSGSVGMTL